jgi:hypothetical protein
MPETTNERRTTLQLILVPAIITLAVTILRLVGELQHWPSPLFNANAGGPGAIVGIVWLPFIFGPYFAIRLTDSGGRTRGVGKGIGFAILGFVLCFGGVSLGFGTRPNFPGKMIVGLALMAVGAWLQFSAWPALAKTLLAYGYAARIPVAIVMFFAIRGSWGTHYDAVEPGYAGPTDLWGKWFEIGVVPQLVFWIVFTIVIGSLFGEIAVAIARREKPAAQAA